MDPFEFFPLEVSEIIVQHLNLLSAIEVSTLWRETACNYLRRVKEITLDLSKAPGNSRINVEELSVSEFQKCKRINMPVTSLHVRPVYQFIFSLPQLKSLSVNNDNWWKSSASDLNFPVNYSIERLILPNMEMSFMEVKALTDGTPNLKHFEMQLLDQETMDHLSAKFPLLKSLTIRALTAQEFTSPDLFPNLESLRTQVVIWPQDKIFEDAHEEHGSKFFRMIMSKGEADCTILY